MPKAAVGSVQRIKKLFRSIIRLEFALCQRGQFSFEQGFAQGRQMVGEYLSFQVVVLVLYHAGGMAVELLVVRLEILVKIAHLDFCFSQHVFM